MIGRKFALAVSLLLSAAVSQGWAAPPEDLVYYSGGKVLRLVRSSTELYVTLSPATAEATRAQLALHPGCTVQSLPWGRESARCFILHTQKADFAQRTRLRATDGVKSALPVYRIVGSDTPLLSTGRLVVRVSASLNDAEREQLFRDYKVVVVDRLGPSSNVYAVRPVGDPQDGDVRTAAAMFRDDRTVFASPDFVVRVELRQVEPQDEFFRDQWHLRNTQQGGGTQGADINVMEAWAETFGEDVLVGILDDAVEISHEDLGGNYINFGHDISLDGENEGATRPNPQNFTDRHGTAVLGLACADRNVLGVRGVAPAARFTASRGLFDIPAPSDFDIAGAYSFARRQGVDVHINSWGFPFDANSNLAHPIIVDAIQDAFRNGRDNKGMVLVWAAGNSGDELAPHDDLGMLAEVIGVGASDANDERSSYSNYGTELDVLAPSLSGNEFLPGMVTTDNTGSSGYNTGQEEDFDDTNYTMNFSGTSAACPVAAGVVALILSKNSQLTAEQVRVILVHTADKVDVDNAEYHPITERSLKYGYGRINAGAAVQAAKDSLTSDQTWPEPLSGVRISSDTILWTIGDKLRSIDEDNDEETPASILGDMTTATLVIESRSEFSDTHTFLPEDEVAYSVGDDVGNDMTVVVDTSEARTNFPLPGSASKRFYALFPVNRIGNYGFGVTIDTDGNVAGVGSEVGDSGGEGGPLPPGTPTKPRVSIDVSPLSGSSPLEVEFRGNALSEHSIESSQWEFDDQSDASGDATSTHLYVVSGSQTVRFFPSFTVIDDQGQTGVRSVAIDVTGSEASVSTNADAVIRIVINRPGSIGSDVDSGISPFSVELNITGTPAEGEVVTVLWDLGDGTMAETFSVPHTYVNTSDVAQTLPISVEVVTESPGGGLVTQRATRFITIEPNPDAPLESAANTTDVDGARSTDVEDAEPTVTTMCGTGSVLTVAGMLLLALVRRRLS